MCASDITECERDACERIRRIVADVYRVDVGCVGPEKTFEEDLCGDSLDFVMLIMSAEEEFGFMIPDSYARRMRKVGDLVRFAAREAYRLRLESGHFACVQTEGNGHDV